MVIMVGTSISCKIIPGIASINPPLINKANVKVFPFSPNNKAFEIPQTILPEICDAMSEV